MELSDFGPIGQEKAAKLLLNKELASEIGKVVAEAMRREVRRVRRDFEAQLEDAEARANAKVQDAARAIVQEMREDLVTNCDSTSLEQRIREVVAEALAKHQRPRSYKLKTLPDGSKRLRAEED